jgi:hypothetical protein
MRKRVQNWLERSFYISSLIAYRWRNGEVNKHRKGCMHWEQSRNPFAFIIVYVRAFGHSCLVPIFQQVQSSNLQIWSPNRTRQIGGAGWKFDAPRWTQDFWTLTSTSWEMGRGKSETARIMHHMVLIARLSSLPTECSAIGVLPLWGCKSRGQITGRARKTRDHRRMFVIFRFASVFGLYFDPRSDSTLRGPQLSEVIQWRFGNRCLWVVGGSPQVAWFIATVLSPCLIE